MILYVFKKIKSGLNFIKTNKNVRKLDADHEVKLGSDPIW